MNIFKKALIAGGCAAILTLGTDSVLAQGGGGGRRGGGNMDPAQRRTQYLESMKTALEITDDTEWTAIEPKVGKAFDARQELMASTIRGMMGGGGRRGGGGGGNGDDNGGNRRQRGGNNGVFGGEPSSAVAALQKAIDDKAPTAEIKTKLKVVQEEQKEKQTKLVAAQEDLRAVLTPRQEAIATLRGLL